MNLSEISQCAWRDDASRGTGTHPTEDRWLTQLEAAELLSCSAKTLYNYRKRGVIPAQAWIQLRGKGSMIRYRWSATMALQNGGAA